MPDATTLLSLSGEGVPPYSARGLTQTLEPIPAAANARRTVNGELIDTSVEELRKYQSTIQCNDQQAPAFDGIWPGQILTVDCVSELAYKTSGGSPSRTVVEGSSRVDGDYTFYRPQLTMMVVNWTASKDEWGAQVGWTLALEEV